MHATEKTGYPSIDKPWLKYYSTNEQNVAFEKKTIFDFAWERNKDNLSGIAFEYFGKKTTYDTFFDKVKRTAASLYSIGIRKDDVVTIASMHIPEAVILIYALNYLGAVSNIVYLTLSEKELEDSITNTGSKLLAALDIVIDKAVSVAIKMGIPLVSMSCADSMPELLRSLYKIKNKCKVNLYRNHYRFTDLIKKGSLDKVEKTDTPDSSAVIVYTSGSTGVPKGVMLSSHMINSVAIQAIHGLVDFKRGEKILYILPPFVGIGIVHLHMMLSVGLDMILHIDLTPEKIIKELFKKRPYAFMGGPALVESFLKHKSLNLSHLRYFVGGGGSITDQQIHDVNEKLKECGSEAIYANSYGMTEASASLCYSNNDINRIGSVGVPHWGVNVKVVEPHIQREMQFGEIGELLFTGPQIMMGYYQNEEETANTLIDDREGIKWLKTGDLGYVDEDGYVYITGRIKRIYITKDKDGVVYKLFPQRIEELLKSVKNVSECATVVIEDKDKINVAVAFTTLLKTDEDSKEKTLKLMQSRIESELPEHMRPVRIEIISIFPTTPSGKVDYRHLENYLKDEK
ncbi:MAG: acyl--CoA ligase [Lachnospiraceae bacterium]|nr:acyl--CoA ligase [Lachnospiraceae bacterium]